MKQGLDTVAKGASQSKMQSAQDIAGSRHQQKHQFDLASNSALFSHLMSPKENSHFPAAQFNNNQALGKSANTDPVDIEQFEDTDLPKNERSNEYPHHNIRMKVFDGTLPTGTQPTIEVTFSKSKTFQPTTGKDKQQPSYQNTSQDPQSNISSREKQFSLLSERHIASAHICSSGQGQNNTQQMLITLSPNTLNGAQLMLCKLHQGNWSINAQTYQYTAINMIQKHAKELKSRFTESGLGDLNINATLASPLKRP